MSKANVLASPCKTRFGTFTGKKRFRSERKSVARGVALRSQGKWVETKYVKRRWVEDLRGRGDRGKRGSLRKTNTGIPPNNPPSRDG